MSHVASPSKVVTFVGEWLWTMALLALNPECSWWVDTLIGDMKEYELEPIVFTHGHMDEQERVFYERAQVIYERVSRIMASWSGPGYYLAKATGEGVRVVRVSYQPCPEIDGVIYCDSVNSLFMNYPWI